MNNSEENPQISNEATKKVFIAQLEAITNAFEQGDATAKNHILSHLSRLCDAIEPTQEPNKQR